MSTESLHELSHLAPLTSRSLDKKTAIAKRDYTERSLALRPAVQLELGASMVAGDVKAHMLALAETCQLLLIVGEPPRAGSLLDLTRDLADLIHARSGAVVYVGCEPLRGRHTFDFIDAQLQIRVPELVARVSEETAKVCPSRRCEEGSSALISYSPALAYTRD